METVKYYILFIFLLITFCGWYIPDNSNYKYTIKTKLTQEETLKHIKNPNKFLAYEKVLEYNIIRVKSKIPFIFKSVDTIKKPRVYYQKSCDCN